MYPRQLLLGEFKVFTAILQVGAKSFGRARGNIYLSLLKSWRNPRSKKDIAAVFVKFVFNRRLDHFSVSWNVRSLILYHYNLSLISNVYLRNAIIRTFPQLMGGCAVMTGTTDWRFQQGNVKLYLQLSCKSFELQAYSNQRFIFIIWSFEYPLSRYLTKCIMY